MNSQFGIVPELFTSQDLVTATRILSLLPDAKNTNEYHAYTNGIDKNHPLYKWCVNFFKPRIEQALNYKFEITVMMLLKEYVPWKVHTDYHKGDLRPGLAFLIPLEWEGPEESRTHTVIFNERSKTTLVDYIKTAQPTNCNSKDLVRNLCSHVPSKDLEFLTLALAARWERGGLIYWDRELLHSSDNFLANGITSKKAIVIFSEKVDE